MRNTAAIVLVLAAGWCGFSSAFSLPAEDEILPKIPLLPDDQLLTPWNQFTIQKDEDDQYPTATNSNRLKRSSVHRPNLSITNQIDVLRHRLLLEMSRRRTEHQIRENKKILESLGKRRKRHARSLWTKLQQLDTSRDSMENPVDHKVHQIA